MVSDKAYAFVQANFENWKQQANPKSLLDRMMLHSRMLVFVVALWTLASAAPSGLHHTSPIGLQNQRLVLKLTIQQPPSSPWRRLGCDGNLETRTTEFFQISPATWRP